MDERLLEETLAAIREDMTHEAGAMFVELIANHLDTSRQGQEKVSGLYSPEKLSARFAPPFPDRGQPLEAVIERFARDVMADSPRFQHPMCMGPPVPPALPVTIWSEALIGALNQNGRIFSVSPTGTALETQLVRWMAEKAGYGEGSGGSFTSGATESNFTALLAARAACMPESWAKGVGAAAPVVLCGDNAHYTVFRATAQLGLGWESAIRVPLKDHRMDMEALAARMRELTQAGQKIMAVVATVGAFGTGTFDDVDTMGTLCEQYGVWLHVDAAHGGSALLSETHRHKLRGIERARSIAWDPHKMMLVPFSAGVLLFKSEHELSNAFRPPEPLPSVPKRRWDPASRTFMSSRRLDTLKVWAAIQRYGTGGLGALYDHLCRLTRILYEAVVAHRAFEPVHGAPDCNILSFRFVGDGTHDAATVDALNEQLFQTSVAEGQELISCATPGGRFVLRASIMNPLTQEKHIHLLMERLAHLGQRLLASV